MLDTTLVKTAPAEELTLDESTIPKVEITTDPVEPSQPSAEEATEGGKAILQDHDNKESTDEKVKAHDSTPKYPPHMANHGHGGFFNFGNPHGHHDHHGPFSHGPMHDHTSHYSGYHGNGPHFGHHPNPVHAPHGYHGRPQPMAHPIGHHLKPRSNFGPVRQMNHMRSGPPPEILKMMEDYDRKYDEAHGNHHHHNKPVLNFGQKEIGTPFTDTSSEDVKPEASAVY